MPTQAELNATMRATVALTVESLTYEQFVALRMCAALDSDPRNRAFDYETVRPLFTDANGMRMHEETKWALVAVFDERFGAGQ